MAKKKAVKKSNRNKKPRAPVKPNDSKVFMAAWVAFCEAVGLGCPMACDAVDFSCSVGLRGAVQMDVKYTSCSVNGPGK